jgi:hypothetical protein
VNRFQLKKATDIIQKQRWWWFNFKNCCNIKIVDEVQNQASVQKLTISLLFWGQLCKKVWCTHEVTEHDVHAGNKKMFASAPVLQRIIMLHGGAQQFPSTTYKVELLLRSYQRRAARVHVPHSPRLGYF